MPQKPPQLPESKFGSGASVGRAHRGLSQRAAQPEEENGGQAQSVPEASADRSASQHPLPRIPEVWRLVNVPISANIQTSISPGYNSMSGLGGKGGTWTYKSLGSLTADPILPGSLSFYHHPLETIHISPSCLLHILLLGPFRLSLLSKMTRQTPRRRRSIYLRPFLLFWLHSFIFEVTALTVSIFVFSGFRDMFPRFMYTIFFCPLGMGGAMGSLINAFSSSTGFMAPKPCSSAPYSASWP
ncbi:Uncharacterized protein TPAR_02835 [Tolypocladium paradoxum]|uniref:Uncharacterized protein n=1 Tax=Tolypocladium paradoxum TaxID=94208 RepID=A0A2S4L3G5_9HYPO|nr:Uncharacterized protein TPAR_02835 [Tolypocladium paradoxum]